MKNDRKFFLCAVAALGVAATAQGAPVSAEKALEIAATFRPANAMRKAPASASEMKIALTASASNGENCYYIVNSANADGFTIVSADDRLPQILGYTTSGTFDPSNVPCNMRWWLDSYKSQIDWFYANSPVNAAPARAAERAKIAPITKTTWNQSAPYNNKCPKDPKTGERSVTGCVATAMAQVMKSYNWPLEPEGSSQSYDFDGRKFDWDNMLNSYTAGNYTDEQANAVAVLMRCCGGAVNMNYSSSASGAYSSDVGYAMYEYFKYDSSVAYHLRDYYSLREWEDLVYGELAKGRPVYYSGQSSEGGHAFVCDGYEGKGYFHFNWGWGGYQDGYFLLYALNPTSGGIGSYEGGYNANQSIYTGLQKRTNAEQIYQTLLIATDGLEYVQQDGYDYLYWGGNGQLMYNPLNSTAEVYLGVKLENANDASDSQFIQLSDQAFSYQQYYGTSSINFSLPDNIKNGTYKVYVAYMPVKSKQWQVVRSPFGTRQYVTCTVNNGNFKFTNQKVETGGKIIAGQMLNASQTISSNGPVGLRFELLNVDSNNDFIGDISMELYSADNLKTPVKTYTYYYTMPYNSIDVFDFTGIFGVAPGKYVIRFKSEATDLLSDDYQVELVETETSDYKQTGMYVSNASPSFAGINAPTVLTFDLNMTDPKATSVTGDLIMSIHKQSDDAPVGSLNFGSITLNKPTNTFNTGALGLNSVISQADNFYWRYYTNSVVNDSTKRVFISEKWPFAAYKGPEEKENFFYNVWRDDKLYSEVIPNSNGYYKGDLVIPNRLGGNVKRIATNAFAFADEVTSISIPGTITNICGGQFYGCSSLTKMEVRSEVPPTLSQYAFAPGAIDKIALTVADNGANIFKRSPEWSNFFFPSWTISLGEGVVIDEGLCKNDAGAFYEPYYVSPTERPTIHFVIPENKSIFIKYSIDGQEVKSDYSNDYFQFPALFKGLGKVEFSLTDKHESIEDVISDYKPSDVFNLAGVRIMRNASVEQLRSLESGIYVIGGRKVFVK